MDHDIPPEEAHHESEHAPYGKTVVNPWIDAPSDSAIPVVQLNSAGTLYCIELFPRGCWWPLHIKKLNFFKCRNY